MELVLTEEEHQALPRKRQNGVKQDDGTYVIALTTDPWVQIDAAGRERDAIKNERDTFRTERDEARDEIKKHVDESTALKRTLKDFETIGTIEDFALAKRRLAELPGPQSPQVAEIQQQIDTLKKERDEEAKAREAAEAKRLVDVYRGRLRDIVTKAGVRPELIDMYAASVERRGLSGEDGRLYVGPAGSMRAADDLINEELSGSLKILVGGAAPAASGGDRKPVPALEPNEITLDGDPAARQAALNKMAGELYPDLVQRTTGTRT